MNNIDNNLLEKFNLKSYQHHQILKLFTFIHKIHKEEALLTLKKLTFSNKFFYNLRYNYK
jgi:hypothetical protein